MPIHIKQETPSQGGHRSIQDGMRQPMGGHVARCVLKNETVPFQRIAGKQGETRQDNHGLRHEDYKQGVHNSSEKF